MGLSDVLPTVLDLVDGSVSPLAQGRSLVPAIRAGKMPEDSFVVSVSANTGDTLSIRTARWRYVGPLEISAETLVENHLMVTETRFADWKEKISTGTQLFDLEAEPGEMINLAQAEPDQLGRLQALLRDEVATDRELFHALGGEAEDARVVLDNETKKRLEALGYLR